MAESEDSLEFDSAGCEIYSWKATGIRVNAGASISVPVTVKHCNALLIHYEFSSEQGDIEFAVYVADGEDEVELVSPHRIEFEKDTIRINVGNEFNPQLADAENASKVITVIFRYSNEYSWLTDKLISYAIHAYVSRPKASLIGVAQKLLSVEESMRTYDAATVSAAAALNETSQKLRAVELQLAEMEARTQLLRHEAENLRKDHDFHVEILDKRKQAFAEVVHERRGALSELALCVALAGEDHTQAQSQSEDNSVPLRFVPKGNCILNELLTMSELARLGLCSRALHDAVKPYLSRKHPPISSAEDYHDPAEAHTTTLAEFTGHTTFQR